MKARTAQTAPAVDPKRSIFPWTRFWTPLNSKIHMGGLWDESEGFLADPEDGFIGKHSNSHLRTTPQLLAKQAGCLVLCGEPGMGKSQTLRSYFELAQSANTIALEFRDIPDAGRFERVTVETPAWAAWRAGADVLTLVVDGVDEGLIKITGFVDYLTDLVRREPLSRMQLVLACRSLEWPTSEGERLITLWDRAAASGVYELCPLRDRDARLAAETVLSGAGRQTVDGFMRSVCRQQVIGLATRPLTLKMLLHEYDAGRGFSHSHRNLYRRYSHYLCGEHDDARRRRLRNESALRLHLPPVTRQKIAGRIAALLLLSGRSAIWPGNPEEAANSDLSVTEIIDGSDQGIGMDVTVTPEMVEAVLESPLFWPKAEGRVGFYHQTFAESLAAEFLRDLPFPQIRSLLCQRDRHGEFVHPPLAELAAWMASESEPLLSHLLAHDPETLLRTDVSAIKESHRADLVRAVFAKAAVGELFDTRGLERFFHTLKHSKLAAQLRPIIRDRNQNHVVRRIAFRIAEACAVTPLFADALAILRDPRDSAIHSLAATALDDLITPKSAARLIRFLKSGHQHPLTAGVRLSIVYALLKQGTWTLTQALPHVEAAMTHRDSSAGILARFAHANDAETLLRACLRWHGCFDSLSRYHALVIKAHDLGLERIEEPRIRRLVARVWWRARLKHQHDGFTSRGDKAAPTLAQRLGADTKLRQRFIADVVSLPSAWAKDRASLLVELTVTTDFPWLLDQAMIGSSRRRLLYARIAAWTYDSEKHSHHWDDLLAGIERTPELRSAFAWLRVWPLNSAETQQQKKNYHDALSWREKPKPARKPKSDPVKVWKRDLDHLPRGKPEDWLNLAYNLFYRGEAERTDDEERRDIRTSPGWKYHDDGARSRIIAGARRLILEVPGNPQHPVGGQSEFDELAYKALYLLKDEIETSRELSDAVRRHWLPIIFDEFSNADPHHLEMMALSYRLDPAAMRALLKCKILSDASKDSGLSLELREFALCWDQPLADFVVELCATEIHNPVTVDCVMAHLSEHDPKAAHELWKRLATTRDADEKRYVAATAALAGWRLFELWDDIWPVLKRDADFARRVFLCFDRSDQKNFAKLAQPAIEHRLAELYLYLRALFPPREDPPTPIGRSYTPTRRMELGRFRDEWPATLAVLGTDLAADELLRISNLLPPEDGIWMRWRWREAVIAARRKAWQPPAPQLVLSLVRKANSRWLVDEDDLLALVLESLTRLEDNLTSQPNSQRIDYWQARRGRDGTKYFAPRDEVDISRRITTWLQSDLAPARGVTVQREVQVQWNRRTDIEVRAVAIHGENLRPLEIVIEVKGCWHPKVQSAHADQLAVEYLQRSGKTHGVYLVVWTKCAKWNDPADKRKSQLRAKTLRAARTEVEKLVAGFDGVAAPSVVRAVVLDATL